ncbi:MAG: hypothetical protein ABEJ42_09270 [Halobacteriaceae archaeon]
MATVREALRADIAGARRAVRAVAARAGTADLLTFFVFVPLVLLAVEAAVRAGGPLTRVDRALFRFPVTADGLARPDLVARAFVSSYAHHGLAHLATNLVTYLVGAGSLYGVAVRVHHRREARQVLTVACLGAPFAVAWGTLASPVGSTAVGFSGVVAAVLGALPVMLFAAAAVHAPVGVDPRWSAPPVFSVIAAVAVIGGLPDWVWVTTAASSLAVTVLLCRDRGHGTVVRGIVPLVRYRHPFVMAGTLVTTAGVGLLFFSVGPNTNVTGHLAGFCLGYAVALVLVTRRRRLRRHRRRW